MRGDGLPDNKAVIDRLAASRDAHKKAKLGKPAITVPLESLHFYEDSEGVTRCCIDMDQIVWLADDMLRKEPS